MVASRGSYVLISDETIKSSRFASTADGELGTIFLEFAFHGM